MDFSRYGAKHAAACESCEYYVYDEETDSYYCSLSLDEDEVEKRMSGLSRGCSYYKFYDEYTSVRRQI
jgi:hypothetical protein